MEFWPAALFGWPSALGGALLLILGVVKRSWGVAAAGALVAAGFGLYLSLNPWPTGLLGLLVLGANVGCVIAVRRRSALVSAALVLPLVAVATYLAYRLS